MKLTADDACQYEADAIADEIGGGLEVNGEFVRRYCSDDVAEILVDVPERYLGDVLTYALGDARGWGYFATDASVLLPVGEVEVQLPDEMTWEEYLDDVDDWTISGEFAYTPMESVLVAVDLDALREAVEDLAG